MHDPNVFTPADSNEAMQSAQDAAHSLAGLTRS